MWRRGRPLFARLRGVDEGIDSLRTERVLAVIEEQLHPVTDIYEGSRQVEPSQMRE